MVYQERHVVSTESVGPDDEMEIVETEPDTVVEQCPVRRTIVSDDPIGTSVVASQLTQMIVWAVVVLGLLIVVLWTLHTIVGLF